MQVEESCINEEDMSLVLQYQIKNTLLLFIIPKIISTAAHGFLADNNDL